MTILINTEDNSAEEKTSKGPYEVETTQRERAGDGCVVDSKNSSARCYSSFTDTGYSRLADTSLSRTPRAANTDSS